MTLSDQALDDEFSTVEDRDQTYTVTVAGNIDSKHWKPFEASWDAIAETLISHPEDPSKAGTAYMPGEIVGSARKKGAVSELSFLVLDCDRGDDLSAIAAKLAQLGLDAVVHSSYSHLTTKTKIRYDDIMRSCGASGITAATACQYLIEKKGLSAAILGEVRIVKEMHQTKDGIFIEVEHDPIQKGRVAVRLKEAFNIAEIMKTRGLTQRQAQELWASYIDAFAKLLGVECDPSCKDVSRAFYWSRHAAGAQYFAQRIVGQPLDLSTLKVGQINATAKQRSAPPTENIRPTRFSEQNIDSLELADLIAAECSEKIRGRTSSVVGIIVECPFDEFHSNAGEEDDKACFVMNASASDHGRCVWKCHHASCQTRIATDFIGKAISDQWFEENALINSGYCRSLADPCRQAREAALELESNSAFEAKNAVFGYLAGCEDSLVHAEVLKLVKERTKLSLGDARGILKQRIQTAKMEARKNSSKPHFIYLTEPFDNIVSGCADLLIEDNGDDPHLFRMSSALIRVGEDEPTGALLSEPVTKSVIRHELNRLATFERLENGIGKSIGCPSDIADHLLNDPNLALPPLTTIVDAPFYNASGELIVREGYHAESFTYHHPRRGLELKSVSSHPTQLEISEAVRLIMDEVDGDFPFSDGSPQSRSSRAHAVALKIEPFVRKMIAGQTPIYVIQKPTPGTGATLFVNAFAQIAFGGPAIPQAEVNSAEEFRKNLTATLMSGASLYWLDNVHNKVDNAGLALATTTEVWRDRILGSSKTVVLPVRCSWIISGNNVELSQELSRRAILIRFDTNIERPAERTGFRHADLLSFIRGNRGLLVWACLTLVQAWIAAGKPLGKESLASYEPWSRVMGGILEVASVPGFLENRDEVKEAAADDDAPMKAFVKIWFSEFGENRVALSGSEGSHEFQRVHSLLDLYHIHCHEIDLGFNAVRRESWPSLLGRTVNRYKNRVFEISSGNEKPFRVKLRAERTSGGAVKWLERIA